MWATKLKFKIIRSLLTSGNVFTLFSPRLNPDAIPTINNDKLNLVEQERKAEKEKKAEKREYRHISREINR